MTFENDNEYLEWRAKKLKEAEEADPTEIVGKKASVATIQGRTYKAFEPQPDNNWQALPPMERELAFDIPKIRKRDATERALSLSSRLWKAALENPAEMQLLLQRIQSTLWESGRPVAFDDIRRVANELMEAAEKREQEKFRKMVSH